MSEVPPTPPTDPWKAVVDSESGGTYWWNVVTNETTEIGEPKPVVVGATPPIAPVTTSTYQISDKSLKNLDDIVAADCEDESLQRYKQALLGAALQGDRGDTSDPRRLIITEFRVLFAPEENLSDIVHRKFSRFTSFMPEKRSSDKMFLDSLN